MKLLAVLALLAATASPLLVFLANAQGGEGLLPFAVGSAPAGCDVGVGEWVYDEAARPMYEEEACPYIQPHLTCQAHGRPDKSYQNWRWQPRGCDLPSFNATVMLEMLRGKRMLFVGDSLNREQYVSLLCLLHRAVPEGARSFETVDALSIFRAKNYDATIEFYWAPLLAESNSDDGVEHALDDRVIRGAPMDRHSRFWKGADVLVFNSYLWWITGAAKIQILRGADNDLIFNIKLPMFSPHRSQTMYKPSHTNTYARSNQTDKFMCYILDLHATAVVQRQLMCRGLPVVSYRCQLSTTDVTLVRTLPFFSHHPPNGS